MPALTSTRPYLIRAMHEWCSDNGFTPYISVFVDKNTLVPIEHVKDNEIILNISIDATSGLQMGNEFINFKSRFSGVVRDLMIPINNVQAIFAKENGQGMSFPKVAMLEDVQQV
ncbi:MAG: ClpXP protease specificity-enhancing factor [Polaromonas sp.]|nr:ClpXP protease specificity-enhancing factor [Polaromonas sp.]